MRLGAFWPYLKKIGLQVRVTKTPGEIKVRHTFPEFDLPDCLNQQTSLREKVKNIYAEMDIIGTPQISVADPFAAETGTMVTMHFARDCNEYKIDSIADTLSIDYGSAQLAPINHAQNKVRQPALQMP